MRSSRAKSPPWPTAQEVTVRANKEESSQKLRHGLGLWRLGSENSGRSTAYNTHIGPMVDDPSTTEKPEAGMFPR